MDGLVKGRIVYYVLSAQDAEAINRRRTSSGSILDRMQSEPPTWPAGAQAHLGNQVYEGDICPAMVVGVWSQDSGCSNLKVALDGTDEYWATSRNRDDDKRPGTWHWMFAGQDKRYDPNKVQQTVVVGVTAVSEAVPGPPDAEASVADLPVPGDVAAEATAPAQCDCSALDVPHTHEQGGPVPL